MIIYKVTNLKDGKIYIGQTTQALSERWWQHCNRSPSQSHRSYLHNAIKKDGVSNFIIEELAKASDIEALNVLEAFYIAKLNTLSPHGYNLHPGGRGKICHPETKEKISQRLKGRPIKNRMNGAPKGRAVSQERRDKISKTMTGVPQPWKHKAIVAVETGIEYESVNAAAKSLKINRATISRLLKSQQKHKKTGLSFKLK